MQIQTDFSCGLISNGLLAVLKTLRITTGVVARTAGNSSVMRMRWTGEGKPFGRKGLSIPQGIPTNVRNCWEVRQANRAVCPLDAPDCRKIGLQGRFSQMGGTARVGGKGAPTAQPTAKNSALKDPLKSDVCLMASEKRAIVDRGSQ